MTLSTRYVKLFARTSKGQLKIWSCWIEGDGITVTSTWGIKGGKMQMTRDTMTSRGKKGTRAFKSPQQVTIEEHTRQVEKKQRAGYVVTEAHTQDVQLKSDLDFDRLPRSFAPAKPIREIALDQALKWDRQGVLGIQRKRDGMRHYIVAGEDGAIRVFSRGMDNMTEHFQRLTQELTLPAGTILDAEFVVTTEKDADDFIAVSEICRSKPDRAKRTMVHKELGGSGCRFMVFDMLFYDRLPTWQLPYAQRREALITALLKAHEGKKGATQFHHVIPMWQSNRPLHHNILEMKKRGWEGLVLWRMDQATVVHLNRSPKRVNCYKFKLMHENDFVATGYELGKGRNAKVVGALNLAYYYGSALTAVGNVGTGFSDKQRLEALRWKYPCVVEVKYEKMTESGLRFPTFLRKRDDKRPRECRL